MKDRLVFTAGPPVGRGSALLHAAVAAGHGARVEELLDNGWPESADENVDLILWAADYGAYRVIQSQLGGYLPDWSGFASRETAQAALELARSWIGVDYVAELRRRLGDANAAVARETVRVDDSDHTERILVTGAGGQWAEVQTTHLAIVTYLEDRLGAVASRDQLMNRALLDRDPNSCNWSQAWFSVKNMPDAEATLRWAATVLLDQDPDARRFAAEVIRSLSIDQESCPKDVLTVLRARLSVESDAEVLVRLIVAFANYHDLGVPPEIVAHADHPDPRIRSQVAYEHLKALSEPDSVASAVETLSKLSRDPDGWVRAITLQVFRDYAFDHPMTGQLIAVGRDDPDPRVRAEALAGLARGGDTAAYEELRRLADEAGDGSSLAWMADAAKGWLEKLRNQKP